MDCLVESNHDFKFGENFPKTLNLSSILTLVEFQNWFLRYVIIDKISRDRILKKDKSLLDFLDLKFSDALPENISPNSFLETSYDPVSRTCILYWLIEKHEDKIEELKIPEDVMKEYNQTLLPMYNLVHYDFRYKLGSTSMVSVCKYLDSKCALKIVSKEHLASGRREGNILTKLGAARGICKLIDWKEYKWEVRLVLDLYDINLRSILTTMPKLPLLTVMWIVYCTLLGLKSLRSRRIVHNDIKPANILLRRKESKIDVVICDFGLARQIPEGKFSITEETVSATEYMSPERVDGQYDEKSDIWSLGIIFYEAIYGCRPEFKDETVVFPKGDLRTDLMDIIRSMLDTYGKRASVDDLLKIFDWISMSNSEWIFKEIDRKLLDNPDFPQTNDYDIPSMEMGELIEKVDNDTVYRCSYEYQDVIVKRITSGMFVINTLADLFERERKIVEANLDHPSIARIIGYHFNFQSRVCYVIREYSGFTYCQWLNRINSINREECKSDTRVHIYFKQLLEALDYLHSRNIAHQDVKPGNIMVTEKNIKLGDFGLSGENPLIYQAPEIVNQTKSGRKSDIWSAGVIYLQSLVPNFFKVFDNYNLSKKGIHRLRNKILKEKTIDDISKRLLLSIFVPYDQRPTASELLRCDFFFPRSRLKVNDEQASNNSSVLDELNFNKTLSRETGKTKVWT